MAALRKRMLRTIACIVFVTGAMEGILMAQDDRDPNATKTRYDRFHNYTTVETNPVRIGLWIPDQPKKWPYTIDNVEVTFFYLCSGQDSKCNPSTVGIRFFVKTDDWKFLDASHNVQLTLLIDGKPDATAKCEWDGTVGEGYVLEYINCRVPVAKFRGLAHAKKIEGQMSVWEFSFGEQVFAMMGQLTGAMGSPSKRGGPSRKAAPQR